MAPVLLVRWYMFNADVVFSIVSIGIAIWYYVESLNFPPGIGNVPGPAFYPHLLFYVWIILAVLLFISGIKNKKVYFAYSLNNNKVKRALFAIGLTLLYLLLWGKGTFILNTTIYLGMIMFIMGENILKIIVSSLIISLFVYYVFNNLFNVLLF